MLKRIGLLVLAMLASLALVVVPAQAAPSAAQKCAQQDNVRACCERNTNSPAGKRTCIERANAIILSGEL